MESFRSNTDNNISDIDREIDLKKIIKNIINQKKIISIFSAFGIFIGYISIFFINKNWQGELQMLLNNNENNFSEIIENSTTKSNFNVGNVFLSDKTNFANKTELQILKSYLVLGDVFEGIKENKEFDKRGINFYDWISRLDLDLIEDTNVLNIKYSDGNKSLVKFVLEKVSDKYQIYSINKKLEKIEKGKKYVEGQLEFYKEKSKSSFNKAKKFAIKHDLLFLMERLLINPESKFEFEKIKPNEKIFELYQLTSEVRKDRLFIDELDKQYRAIILAKDLANEPWVLISNPQIIKKQFISDKNFILIGLIIGFSLGVIVALLIEKKRDKLFSNKEIEYYVKYPIIDTLSIKKIDEFTKLFEFISNILSVNQKGDLGLLIIDEMDSKVAKKIRECSNLLSKDRNIFISKDINTLFNCDNFIIFITFDLSTRKTLLKNINKLILQKKSIIGIVSIKQN